MLRSLIGAPPHAGPEQRLRRKRPQEPGGCVKSPIALRLRSWSYPSCRLRRKASFLGLALDILMNCGVGRHSGSVLRELWDPTRKPMRPAGQPVAADAGEPSNKLTPGMIGQSDAAPQAIALPAKHPFSTLP